MKKKSTHPGQVIIQRMLVDAQAFAHLPANLRLGLVRLVVRGEIHVIYGVRKVVAVPVVLQVRHEVVYPGLGRLEGAARRKVDVPDDLVHPHEAGDIAALRRLLLDVIRPVLLNALQNPNPKKPLSQNFCAPKTQDRWETVRAPGRSR